jgi:hypothetical protein
VKVIKNNNVHYEDFNEYEMTEENKIFRIDFGTNIEKCINIEYSSQNGRN